MSAGEHKVSQHVDLWTRGLDLVLDKLSPPLLVMIIVLSFLGSYLFRNRGWRYLVMAWSVNLGYICLESYSEIVKIAGTTLGQPSATSISTLSSIGFGLYWVETTRPARANWMKILIWAIGISIIIYTNIVMIHVTGSILAERPVSNGVWFGIYIPNIAYSSFCTICASRAMAGFVESRRVRFGRIAAVSLFLYGVLQLAYFAMRLEDKLWVTIAFYAAFFCKVTLALGLFMLFKVQTERAEQRRIHVWQMKAFSALAHEIKNSTAALSRRLKAARVHLDKRNYSSVERELGSLQNDLLMIQNIVDEVTISSEPIDARALEYVAVNAVLDDAIANVRMASYLDVPFAPKKQYAANMWVCVNRYTLIQIFVNLTRNAIEASVEARDSRKETKAGTLRYEAAVYFKTERRKISGTDCCAVSIIDTGPGIPPDRQAAVFEPYVTTKKGVNRGLGLWIVRSYVEQFGGGVEIVSPLPGLRGGTEMQIWLPLANHARERGLDCVDFFAAHTPEME